jgi:hypothetical protein
MILEVREVILPTEQLNEVFGKLNRLELTSQLVT